MTLPAFSSEVELTLVIGDQSLPLSHTNESDVILSEPGTPFPPTNAELVVTVDGVERRRSVHLPNGITPQETRVLYQASN